MDVRGMDTGPYCASVFDFKEAAVVEALGERKGLRMEVTERAHPQDIQVSYAWSW